VPFPAGLGFSPWGITAGLGALWFAAGFGVIGRIANAGVITEYQMMNETDLRGITAGDGELWFADSFDSSIGQAGFVTAGLSVSPASGAVPTPLTFTGSAFAPDETVSIYARGIGAGLLATANADASGSFTASAPEPPSPYGPRLFFGVGQSSGRLGAASFSATPRLFLSPNSRTVGSTVLAQGVGLVPGKANKIYWQNPRTLLGTVTANYYGTANGNAALTFTVPEGAAPGIHLVFCVQTRRRRHVQRAMTKRRRNQNRGLDQGGPTI
jgi:hypothetical protein